MRDKFVRYAAALAVLSGGMVAVQSDVSRAFIAEGFVASVDITGLDRPTNLEFAPDGRVFVAEQSGLIKVFDDMTDSTPTIAVDMRDLVHSVDGRGLLGMALDPNFPDPPHMYVSYTFDAPIGGTAPSWGKLGDTHDECPLPPGPGKCVASGRLSRLTLDGDIVVNEEVLIEDWCQEWTAHSIGDLKFGPDGALYASGGDGAFAGQPDWGQRSGRNACGDPPVAAGGAQTLPTSEGGALRAQDLRTPGDPAGLNGTVIRIDKQTGLAMPDNPAAGSADPNVERIISYGFRNPFRLEFRPGTSELFIADVGWNSWEEINRIADPLAPVANYGWPCYEGPDKAYDIGATICDDLYADGIETTQQPYFDYEQTVGINPGDACLNNNGSPSALEFYQGGAYPDEYDGALFFGDYSRRCLWAMLPDAAGNPDPTSVVHILNDEAVVDLEMGPAGDLYILSIFGGGQGGKILHLRYPSGTATPLAQISADPTAGSVPLAVALSAEASRPSVPGESLDFVWDLDGDGEFDDATGPTANVTYEIEGVYVPRVRVTDIRGETDEASLTISAGDPPTVSITAPATGLTWIVDDQIQFAGSATNAAGEDLPADALAWDLTLHHCETLDDCHTHVIGTVEGQTSGTFLAPEHEYPSYIDVSLTATSVAGLRATSSVSLYPETATLTLDTNTPGTNLTFNGDSLPAPSSHEVIVGSTNSVGAPTPQPVGDTVVDFESWDDGLARNHDVLVTNSATVTASFAVRQGTTAVGATDADPTVAAVPADGAVSVSWTPVSGATGYQFRYRVLKRTWQSDPTTTTVEREVTGLTNGVDHTFQVRAMVNGRWGSWTSVVEQPGDPVTDPGGGGGGDPGDGGGDPGDGGGDPGDSGDSVTVNGGSNRPTVTVDPRPGGFTASWPNVPRAKRYQLKHRLVGESWTAMGPSTSQTSDVDGLAGGDHQVEVRAYVDKAWKGWTHVDVAIPAGDGGGDPGDGGGDPGDGGTSSTLTVDVTPATKGFTADWSDVTGATKYQSRYRTLSRSWRGFKTGQQTTRTVSGLPSGLEHTVQVRAYVDGSWSGWVSTTFTTI